MHHPLCNQAVNSTLSHNTQNRFYYDRKVEIVCALTPTSDTETVVAVKPSCFSRKQPYTSCEITMLQRSAVVMVIFQPAPPSTLTIFPGLLWFECAAKSNITHCKSVQSLLLQLPRLLSLSAPTWDVLCAPLPPGRAAFFFYSSLLWRPHADVAPG